VSTLLAWALAVLLESLPQADETLVGPLPPGMIDLC